MQKKFYADVRGAYTAVGVMSLGIIMMSTALVGHETTPKLILGILLGLVILYLLWLGLAKGTYITINDKEIKGKILYFFGGKTPISSIVSLKKTGSFGGMITQIYMMCQREDGSIKESGLTSREMLKPEDLKDLIDTIRTINPNIEIPHDLLSK